MKVLQEAVSELYRRGTPVEKTEVVATINEVAEQHELPSVDFVFTSNTGGWGVRFKGVPEPVWLAAA